MLVGDVDPHRRGGKGRRLHARAGRRRAADHRHADGQYGGIRRAPVRRMLRVGLDRRPGLRKDVRRRGAGRLRLPADPGGRTGPRGAGARRARLTNAVVREFGREILTGDGRIDRRAPGGAWSSADPTGWRGSTPWCIPPWSAAKNELIAAFAARQPAWHRGGGSGHPDRNRQLLAVRPNDSGDLHRGAAGGARPAARRRAWRPMCAPASAARCRWTRNESTPISS